MLAHKNIWLIDFGDEHFQSITYTRKLLAIKYRINKRQQYKGKHKIAEHSQNGRSEKHASALRMKHYIKRRTDGAWFLTSGLETEIICCLMSGSDGSTDQSRHGPIRSVNGTICPPPRRAKNFALPMGSGQFVVHVGQGSAPVPVGELTALARSCRRTKDGRYGREKKGMEGGKGKEWRGELERWRG